MKSTTPPPRPWLLSLVLAVDALLVLGALGYGLVESRGGILLFSPLVLAVLGIVYACKEMNPIALRLRGAIAVMALVGANGWFKQGQLDWAIAIGAWGLFGLAGCWAARAAYRYPKRTRSRGGAWNDALEERPARGRLASAWDEAPPRPFVLTALLIGDGVVLCTFVVGATSLFADREGGFAMAITVVLALAAVDILAWQMHRFGLVARGAGSIVLLIAALTGPGPLSYLTLVAFLHAIAACAAVGIALRDLAADRTNRDPHRFARTKGTVSSASKNSRGAGEEA